jgi:hypothetical protein
LISLREQKRQCGARQHKQERREAFSKKKGERGQKKIELEEIKGEKRDE